RRAGDRDRGEFRSRVFSGLGRGDPKYFRRRPLARRGGIHNCRCRLCWIVRPIGAVGTTTTESRKEKGERRKRREPAFRIPPSAFHFSTFYFLLPTLPSLASCRGSRRRGLVPDA